MARPGKPWHEVVALRDELRTGELPLHLFAADLYEVIMQTGRRPIYEDPHKFFALTLPTYNLRRLVREVVLRLAGRSDKAVRQLELTYGGGKTHTLIALWHLVNEPDRLPGLPAVAEFIEAIGQAPPKARVAGLCFDKLDVEKGMEVRAPDGQVRALKYPWSVLAYQLAGDEGLRVLHADSLVQERETAPAENLLTTLLELPVRQGLSVLILIDEVLMYVREKVAEDSRWQDRLVNFFQYLTQAATKVDRCSVVASLRASDPTKGDSLGRRLEGELYDVFQRQREEAVEPVGKDDVAELLRRRFFTPESTKEKDAFRPHIQAALKGVCDLDEQTQRRGAEAEERYLKSYPFHPDLTEVFYTKWTQLGRFQKARGILRTFALALREAEKWDTAPLVGPGALLRAPGGKGLAEAMVELVAVADTEEHEGRRQAWTSIIEGELERARDIQRSSVGLRSRELEQAVIATFLHSQPIGQSARSHDLLVLLGAGRPDRIELEKGLRSWAQVSFWLDDRHTAVGENQLPGTWRLGNRPNLTQMHAAAAGRVPDEVVRARLLDEIGRVKQLTAGAAAAGVRVHSLPTRPRDIEDDGQFHYAVLGPNAASEPGKPSPEAKRYLDETTGPDKPRVYRNAVLLLTPVKDGLEVASARVRDYLAWEQVRADLREYEKEGSVDPVRQQTLSINLDRAKGRIPEAIRQAYCMVVTVSEQDQVQAFKISVSDESHFNIIKSDRRSRAQDSPVTAEALLPGGPYNLWRGGESSRRVKDLAGAFAQLPYLPKMLKAQAIRDTLAEGCAHGTFVLRLTRPDGSSRTWWHRAPDETAMNDVALELVLPSAAELAELNYDILLPGRLPELWRGDELTVQGILDYFGGQTTVEVRRGGYTEALSMPRAGAQVVYRAVTEAVAAGVLWLTSGPASVLAEPIPAGILTPKACLREPPAPIGAVDILPANLPDAWTGGQATAMSIAVALSHRFGRNLPWKTVRDVISASLNARFTVLDATSGEWPCAYPVAQFIKLGIASTKQDRTPDAPGPAPMKGLVARAELQPVEVQDLGDAIPRLLEVKAKFGAPVTFLVEVRLGDGQEKVPEQVTAEVNALLRKIRPGFEFK